MVLLLMGMQARAQVNTSFSDLSGAAGLVSAQKGTQNVNLHTGTPVIELPLLNYANGDLKLSLSLKYNATGIKVMERSSIVGLGWNFSAGGIIIRNMRGLPDDYPGIGYIYTPPFTYNYDNATLKKYDADSLDAQADIFSYSFGGRSGQFLIDKEKKVIVIPQSKIKTEPLLVDGLSETGTLSAFRIITEDGTTYIFRELERSKFLNSYSSGILNDKLYTTAWHLSEVISPFATNRIQFQYNDYNTNEQVYYPASATIRVNGTTETGAWISNRQNNGKLISKIALPYNQSILFDYVKNPGSNSEELLLRTMQLFDGNEFRYGYRLEYACLTTDPNSPYKNQFVPNVELGLSNLQSNKEYVRVFLKKLRKITPQAWDQPYELEYNATSLLPPRIFSTTEPSIYSQDHWGYYNGKINFKLIPASTTYQYMGGDRTASLDHVLAGSLKSITTPGGGAAEYLFESNDRLKLERESNFFSMRLVGSVVKELKLAQYYSNVHRLTIKMGKQGYDTPPYPVGCTYNFQIKNNDGATVANVNVDMYQLFYTGEVTWDIPLPNGIYKMQADGNGCNGITPFSIEVYWNNTSLGAKEIGGGLRVKKITMKAGNGSPDIVKSYKYVLEDGIRSSGYMPYSPEYIYTYQRQEGDGSIRDAVVVSSEVVNSLNYLDGNPIGYSRVEVIEGDENKNIGRTIYDFSDFRDIQFNERLNTYPYLPIYKADWGLGLPKRIRIIDQAGQLKRITNNEYNIIRDQNNNPAIGSFKLSIDQLKLDGITYKVSTYFPITGRVELQQSVDTVYYDDKSYQFTKQQFEYHPYNYRIKKETSDFDQQLGLKREKRYYYPEDYQFSSGPLKYFKDNQITAPVATEEWITGDGAPRMIGADIVEYKEFIEGLIRPYKKYRLKSVSPVSETALGAFDPQRLLRNTSLFKDYQTFVSYQRDGTLLQQVDESNHVMTNLFGMDKSMPLAMVRYAQFDDIAYTSFESDDKGNWNYSGTAVSGNAVTGKFAYSLAGGTITKVGLQPSKEYQVSFWSTNGSVNVSNSILKKSVLNSNTGWKFNSYTISGTSSVTITGGAVVDEIRLHPVDAIMTTQHYVPFIGIESSADDNGQIFYREYDVLNNLKLVRNTDKHIISKSEYGYNNNTSTDAIWEYTGVFRCVQNQYGNTGVREAEQIDVNLNSATYTNKRWVVADNTCAVNPVWVPTGNKRCKPMIGGVYTGEIEIEMKNTNPNHSATIMWVSGGIDAQLCPDPCTGREDRKIVNGICETGRQVYIRTKVMADGSFICFYVYEFSDGSRTREFSHVSDHRCTT